MSRNKKPKIWDQIVTIEQNDETGFGLANTEIEIFDRNGQKTKVIKKCQIIGAIAGEKVLARLSKKAGKDYLIGEVLEVLEKSVHRQDARDDGYLSTSPWQIINLSEQNKLKQNLVSSFFSEYPNLKNFDEIIKSAEIVSPNPSQSYGYRNKMEFGVFGDEDGLNLCHYLRTSSFFKRKTRGSALINQGMNNLAQEILGVFNQINIRAGQIKAITLRCGRETSTNGLTNSTVGSNNFDSNKPKPSNHNSSNVSTGYVNFSHSSTGDFVYPLYAQIYVKDNLDDQNIQALKIALEHFFETKTKNPYQSKILNSDINTEKDLDEESGQTDKSLKQNPNKDLKKELQNGENNLENCLENSLDIYPLKHLALIYSNPKSPANVVTEILLTKGSDSITSRVCGVDLEYHFDSFFQVNIPIFENLMDDLNGYLKNYLIPNNNSIKKLDNQNLDEITNKPIKILDLYAGVGTIGLCLKKVLGGDQSNSYFESNIGGGENSHYKKSLIEKDKNSPLYERGAEYSEAWYAQKEISEYDQNFNYIDKSLPKNPKLASNESVLNQLQSNYRQGDYLLPVDFENQKVFVQVTKGGEVFENQNYPLLGGGREPGENGLECLKREVLEESSGNINLYNMPQSKISFLGSFLQPGNWQTFGYQSKEQFGYEGKVVNLYLYPTNVESIKNFEYFGDESLGEKYDWIDLSIFLENSKLFDKDKFFELVSIIKTPSNPSHSFQILGIESCPGSRQKAFVNAQKLDLKIPSEYDFVEAEAEKCLDMVDSESILIVDPPRSGLHPDLTKQIAQKSPKMLVYISCNPKTQARDLSLLNTHLSQNQKPEYKLDFYRLYNFYPHTPHCEALAILKLEES